MVEFLRAVGEITGGLVPGYTATLVSLQTLLILVSFAVLSAAGNRRVGALGGHYLSTGLSKLSPWALVAASMCLMMLLAWFESPTPTITDEFSYLLAADTFASGRLTNPTHPKWEFFETFHVLMQPTYQSKYFPGQGLVLALGQKIFHYPIVGIWIFLCLGIVATCWMLQGWFSRKWSMFGATLAAVFVVFSDISQSFIYNPCTFLGGVLVLGSAKRIVDPLVLNNRRSILCGTVFGIGAGMLLLSRPFEGGCLCAATVGWLWWSTPFKEFDRLKALFVFQATGLLFVGGFGAFLLHYNQVVTGDAWTFPYALHDQRYLTVPVILWQKFTPATEWTNYLLGKFYSVTMADFLRVDWQLESVTHFLAASYKKLECFAVFYPNMALMPVFLLGMVALWKSKDRPLLIGVFATGVFTICSTACWVSSYGLHLLGPVVLAAVFGFRSLFTWHRNFQREGARIALSLVVAIFISYPLVYSLRRCFNGPYYQTIDSFNEVRETLKQIPGKLILFVNYEDFDLAVVDWVYNAADIDSARVVWARDLGKKKKSRTGRLLRRPRESYDEGWGRTSSGYRPVGADLHSQTLAARGRFWGGIRLPFRP